MSWKPNQDLKSFDKVPSVKHQVSSPPNVSNLNNNFSSKERSKNRSHDVRRDKDTVKDFGVKLKDVDETIINHLRNLKMTVLNEGTMVEVPVVYASPERWKSIQQDGYFRDHKGQLQLPIMTIKRGISHRNESLKIFNRYGEHLSMPFIRKYSDKNAYDRFSVTSQLGIQHNPVHEVHNSNLPDHYVISYDCIVWTDRVDQNNKIIERIAYNTEDYWGDDRYFKFRTTVTNVNFQTEVSDGENRMVRSSFTIQVYAYLLPEYYRDFKPTTQKTLTKRKVVWGVRLENSGDYPNSVGPIESERSFEELVLSGSICGGYPILFWGEPGTTLINPCTDIGSNETGSNTGSLQTFTWSDTFNFPTTGTPYAIFDPDGSLTANVSLVDKTFSWSTTGSLNISWTPANNNGELAVHFSWIQTATSTKPSISSTGAELKYAGIYAPGFGSGSTTENFGNSNGSFSINDNYYLWIRIWYTVAFDRQSDSPDWQLVGQASGS